ncbi:12613_t:CDS:2 [Cetraspora pellucida]|uniref:12613_t:CDS:1 n=1 Tax=Cetraspora pellucida TaxID=1433469 RepID=A0ACA9L394_9GLOM|nr:12613_t:CDS:2 [Cetraspora pellucida]
MKDELQLLRKDRLEHDRPEKTRYKNKVYCLIQELLLGYIKKFSNAAHIETLSDNMYFDIEINKLNQYFIDKDYEFFKTTCEIDNVNKFTSEIIKKHYFYKLVKDIFEEDENNIEKFSKLVNLTDNERTLLKKIRPLIHDYRILNKINTIKGKDNSDTIFNKETRHVIEPLICVNEILKVYKNVIPTTEEEISYLRSLLLNNIIKYPSSSYFTIYDHKVEQEDNFFINARTITQQYFLDIVYRILVK